MVITPARPLDLVIIGNATIDDLVFPDGTTRMYQIGGNAVYAVHGALLWGVSVGLCAVTGADYPADLLAAGDLDLSGVQRVDSPSLRNWALYEDDATCQYVFRGSYGPKAHAHYSPMAEQIPPTYRHARYAHIAPVPFEPALQLLDALGEARRHGGVSVDPDARYAADLGPSALDELLSRPTFFLPSQREAALLFPDRAPEEVLDLLRRRYPNLKVAVVKLGARGCLVFDRATDRIVLLPAASARVVDTTGAGDAFCGGFLAGYVRTGDGIEAALHGIISASFIVETIGIPPPGTVRRQDVDDRLAAYRQTQLSLQT